MDKQIDYNLKIVSYEGRKAKVVSDSGGSNLVLALLEDGKYRGATVVAKKQDVELLDRRKNPERYELSEEQKDIIDSINALITDIEAHEFTSYATVRKLKEKLKEKVDEAKKLGIYVKDIEYGPWMFSTLVYDGLRYG